MPPVGSDPPMQQCHCPIRQARPHVAPSTHGGPLLDRARGPAETRTPAPMRPRGRPWNRSGLLPRVAVAAVVLGHLAGWSVPALAQNPYDARQRELGARVSRAGRSAQAIVPLLELWRNWDQATPTVTMDELERLSVDRRLSVATRMYAGGLLARARLRTGDVRGSNEATSALGYVTDFRVIGPFDNEGKEGFARELPPESVRNEAFDGDVTYPGKERPVRWRSYPDIARFGYVDLDATLRPNVNVCAVAETVVTTARAEPLSLWIGAGGAVKAYWNGTEVLSDDVYRQPDPDRAVAVVAAAAGPNRLLIKSCVADATWGLFVRIGDAAGNPRPDLHFAADLRSPAAATEAAPATAPANLRLPSPPLAPLAALEAAGAREGASAAATEDLARFLAYTGADDPDQRRARQLAARAADGSPTVARLVLAASLADERGESMRFAEQARAMAPQDPETILLLASLRSTGPAPEDALRLLDRLPRRGVDGLRALELRASILADFDLPESAARLIEDGYSPLGAAPGLLRARAEAARSIGQIDRSLELYAAAAAARHDDRVSRKMLLADALHRLEPEKVVEHLDALLSLAPGSIRDYHYAAGIYEALGRTDDATTVLARAHDIAPEDAGIIVAQGRLLLRTGQRDAAIAAFREAMVLRPQDASTRELLEQIRPSQRRDESYAVATEELLSRRGDANGFPLTVLEDLTVNTVFANGLGSSFHQYAVEVHDEEGARRFRTYSIQFDPDTQRIEIRGARVHRRGGRVLEATQSFEQQLGEPWYRIYYDTRALVVVFPDLEPGDVIDLQYRLDDVAHRNMFADYYGDVHFFQGFTPVRRVDYILITPKARRFYFNRPSLPQLRYSRTDRDDQRIHHYHATDVPAIRDEDGMPGMTEVAPYLHVSTYRSWEAVGRWYWGLIRDQLQVDDNLRRVVRELTADGADLTTKVQRIYDWVVSNTRYVGLEFGIHGFKPYRVPLIVQRGFGDCKDKASLLYTMLREAGIDARIVLARTRRNGAIDDLPASLSVFDHAIAYVPELDLYLDGTAEHSGTTELPTMDQGITVLAVGPDSAELRRTPILPPERNLRRREVRVSLAADGSAVIDVSEHIVGEEASSYRNRYQAQGTRRERFERSLRHIFPGLVLEDETMTGLDDREVPIDVRYRARVPQMAQREGSTLRLSPSVLDDLLRTFARAPTRRLPLDLGATRSYDETRVIEVPRGFSVAGMPEGGAADSEFGRLTLSVEGSAAGQRPATVTVHTELRVPRDRLSAEEYPGFRRWVGAADRLLRQRVRLEGGAQ